MDGVDEDGWSNVAAEWAALWGDFSGPARQALIDASGIGPGSRVLDVGCGSGEFLSMLNRVGAFAAGTDPAPGMLEVARRRSPAADIRPGTAEAIPWPDDSFDVVTAVNALQFAESTRDALAEAVRVAVPGGSIAVSNWAEGELNDLNTLEAAVAHADGEELAPDGPLGRAGGLEALFRDGGLELIAAGLVDVPWEAIDDDALVDGVLLGEAAERALFARVVVEAAQPFRTASGSYRLVNRFRYAVGRIPK
jgi:SAM-dependent methyltransferase